eukprot:254073-Chlamydomonas_euryale.AAC.2
MSTGSPGMKQSVGLDVWAPLVPRRRRLSPSHLVATHLPRPCVLASPRGRCPHPAAWQLTYRAHVCFPPQAQNCCGCT